MMVKMGMGVKRVVMETMEETIKIKEVVVVKRVVGLCRWILRMAGVAKLVITGTMVEVVVVVVEI